MKEKLDIPESWEETEFAELLNYIQPTKYIVKNTEYNDNFKIPVLTAGKSFIKGYTNEEEGVFADLPVIIFDDFTTSSKYVNFPFKVKSSAMKILIPCCDLINLKFLFYKMQVTEVRNDTHKRYWISVYAKKKLHLPPFNEQRRIVEKLEALFSDLDNGTESLKKAQNQLKTYRQALLKNAFEGKLTEKWRKENNPEPAEKLLEQIKLERQKRYEKELEEWNKAVKKWEEEGKQGRRPKRPQKPIIPAPAAEEQKKMQWELPKNWLWTQLGETCFVTKLAGFEYTDYVKYDKDGDLFVLKAENVGDNGFKKTDFSKVSSGKVLVLNRSRLFGGELLIVFVGAGTGNVATVPFNREYFLGPNIGMARPYKDVNTKFLEYFYRSKLGKNIMMVKSKAVAQPSLSMGTIRQSPIVLTSLEEQNQIVSILEEQFSVIDKLEEEIEKGLKKAEMLRQSILKKAFEGKLVPQDPNDEPASELLERIKAEKEKYLAEQKQKKRKYNNDIK